MTTESAPLERYSVVGVETRIFKASADAPAQPGGSCWHCGQGIMVCVLVRHADTGQTETIGTTCAERVGLSGPELRKMLAEKYAEERAERRAAASAERRQQLAEEAALAEATYGPHGTVSRWESGCYCAECRKVAPHGTTTRFFEGCHCLPCIDAVLTCRPEFTVREVRVLIDLSTGKVANARAVDTKYGYRWCVEDGRLWMNVHPARRSTLANKGYTEAQVPYFGEVCGRGLRKWFKPVARVGSAVVDEYGEPIPRAAA